MTILKREGLTPNAKKIKNIPGKKSGGNREEILMPCLSVF